jgi:hypothetical protein
MTHFGKNTTLEVSYKFDLRSPKEIAVSIVLYFIDCGLICFWKCLKIG